MHVNAEPAIIQDQNRHTVSPASSLVKILSAMKPAVVLIAFVTLCISSLAQSAPEPNLVTVPITLDHNRIVIDVNLTLPDGSAKRIRGWVDNGNPDLEMSRRVATLLGLNVTCDDKSCSAPPPQHITISNLKIPLTAIKMAKIPLKPVEAASVAFPGMSAEINIPSTILRNYEVLVDFPDREFSIGSPGSLKFKGVSNKILVNAENGLIQIPSQIENKKCNLALDFGSSISFLSEELFDKLAAAHPDWPHMTSAVGPANMWGLPDEPKWKLMRLERLQYGQLYLTSVPVVRFAKETMAWFEKRAGVSTVGLLGSEALLNYRIGLDYAHSMVYFDIGSTFKFPDFDVIGLTLRPEDDTRFTILGVADIDGKPSVPEIQPGDHLLAVDSTPVPDSTMGQVWSMLEGQPGQERKLTVERAGKQFIVAARVQHFLAEAPDKESKGKSSKKK